MQGIVCLATVDVVEVILTWVEVGLREINGTQSFSVDAEKFSCYTRWKKTPSFSEILTVKRILINQ